MYINMSAINEHKFFLLAIVIKIQIEINGNSDKIQSLNTIQIQNQILNPIY
jgi:hypothetical protein